MPSIIKLIASLIINQRFYVPYTYLSLIKPVCVICKTNIIPFFVIICRLNQFIISAGYTRINNRAMSLSIGLYFITQYSCIQIIKRKQIFYSFSFVRFEKNKSLNFFKHFNKTIHIYSLLLLYEYRLIGFKYIINVFLELICSLCITICQFLSKNSRITLITF